MAEEKKIEFSHRSVLLDECMDGLNIRPDGIYVDGTAGGAGHSSEIARRLGNGKLIAMPNVSEKSVAASKAHHRLSANAYTLQIPVLRIGKLVGNTE